MSSAEQRLDPVIEQALKAATAAPSLFNSQPWRVRAAGSTVLVCADRDRRLPIHDPCDRELLIACGAFSLYAEVALLAAGLTCRTEHLPEPTFAPDVVAVLQVKPGESGAASHRHTRRLANVMALTEYDRRPFTPTRVTPDQITLLRDAVEAEGAWLLALDGDRRIEAAVLHTHAHDMLGAEQHAVDELQQWIRHQDVYDDGVSADAVDPHSNSRACSFSLRDFEATPDRRTYLEPPEPEHPLITLLCTAHDGPGDAVTAGRALGRLLLEVAAAGLAASPLNQALQTSMRWRLPAALSLTGVPQYQLRVGTPTGEPVLAHRRPLAALRLPPSGTRLIQKHQKENA